jgi:hypothetical protein
VPSMEAIEVWAHRALIAWLLWEAGLALVELADEIALRRHARRQARR